MTHLLKNDKRKKLLIGGTGRSGTTIIAQMLGLHPEIYTFPKEIRFITDPDGVISLKSALVDNWSFFQGDFAIERFFNLMTKLKKKTWGAYPTIDFSSMVGADFYDSWLNELRKELIEFEFNSNWIGRTTGFKKVLSKKILTDNNKRKPFFPKSYFSSRKSDQEFYAILSGWLDDFFIRAAEFNNKRFALDHTPMNNLHADFFYNLMPESKMLHVYRDPRDVISSFTTQEWGSTPENNLKWVNNIYKTWDDIKRKLPEGYYYELAFETFIENPETEMKKILDFYEIDFHPSVMEIKLNKPHIGRYHKNLSPEVIKKIEETINPRYFPENR